ncbi:ADAMTS12 [Acanthosepion pharaonis]|uniref:ADAMTS12 n=1 Tax=Acanthosepion pharaonis TaxID=158019 RepID=A0A812B607_ACAPH|nr:ADAMTS12 [Sepia pharaonis]
MGGHGTNFSRCSVEAFKTFIEKKRGNCLFVENVHKPASNMKGVTLNGLLPLPVQKGSWGEWGPFSPCSRTCGTGVMISQRECDSPKPVNSADCPGNGYKAKLCNLKPCATDSNNAVQLANNHATEVCRNFVKTGVLSSATFLQKGHVYNIKDTLMGCEVMCQPKKGHHRQRMGLMPDGSPCFKPNSDYKFPAHDKNVKYRCLKGVCQVFDCANQFPPSEFGKSPKCEKSEIIGW